MNLSLAWRNLWRNRRRSLLSAGGIAFAVMLLVFMMCFQLGQYRVMIDNGTALIAGHAQVQHPDYEDTPRLRFSVQHAAALRARLEADPAVAVAGLRAQAFVLMTNGDNNTGVQLMGVQPSIERRLSTIPEQLSAGRFLTDADGDALVIGAATARTLEVGLGDEVVILGNARDGTVAALVLPVVGIFETAQPEINRSFAYVPLPLFQDAFLLDDAASVVVLRMTSSGIAQRESVRLQAELGPGLRVLPWSRLMPELRQSINFDWYSGLMIYGLLSLMVVFSIVNTFVMNVYERTREFGMLLALGARPGRILATLQLEALLLALIGIGAGVLAGIAIVLVFAQVGISLGEQGGELMRRFHMPERMYPALLPVALVAPPLLMLAATQLAGLIPALHVLRLQPVEALRAEE